MEATKKLQSVPCRGRAAALDVCSKFPSLVPAQQPPLHAAQDNKGKGNVSFLRVRCAKRLSVRRQWLLPSASAPTKA